ncbi:hypothetical protein C8J57DRAFT_1401002 [Mycena rebaudengoi]|nr:hypothetical protein C8J57DRAFT_1401002 [Mycena rebaudengoi]
MRSASSAIRPIYRFEVPPHLRSSLWAMISPPYIFTFLAFLSTVSARPEIVSSTWRKAAVSIPLADRVSLANAALEKVVEMLPVDSEFHGTAFYEMAEFDIVAQKNTYEALLEKSLSSSIPRQTDLKISKLNNGLSFGHAAIRAYEAYKNPVFLEFANRSFQFARANTVYPEDVVSGEISGKDSVLQGSCNELPLVGGTFTNNNSSDTTLAAFSSTYFLGLSALLAEATSDPIFLEAALQSADFIHTHLLDGDNLVHDSISAVSCAVATGTNSFNAGLMIEGLSVLATITNNASIIASLNDIIAATISNPAFQTDEGIIARGGSKLGDMYIVRGLAAAFSRGFLSPEIREFVQGYLGVQFNAVIDFARSGNIYAGAWTGPPSSSFSQANQTSALSTLISAISFPDSSTSTPTPGASPSTTHSPATLRGKTRAVNAAALAGGIVGGLLLISSGILSWFILRRRSRRRKDAFNDSDDASILPALAPSLRPQSPLLRTRPLPSPWAAKVGILPTPPPPIPSSTLDTYNPTSASRSDTRAPLSPDELPTTELVRVLNARLRGRQWDGEEPPPQYGRDR